MGKKNKSVLPPHHSSERAEATERLTAIGQLAAGIAHELNNPLCIILGYAQNALSQSIPDTSLHTSLKTIERESQRCKRLIQDLLDFSRLPERRKAWEDIIDVVEGALSLVQAQTRVQTIELIREFEPGLPRLYIDRHRIQQMMINLCINGMDAMPQGGTLTVKLSQASDLPRQIEISVIDQGTGITANIRKHIFKPFFTTKEQGKGTGLGLSLVRDIVKEHDGRLEVSSHAGKRTMFTIWLNADSRRPVQNSGLFTNPEPDQTEAHSNSAQSSPD